MRVRRVVIGLIAGLIVGSILGGLSGEVTSWVVAILTPDTFSIETAMSGPIRAWTAVMIARVTACDTGTASARPP